MSPARLKLNFLRRIGNFIPWFRVVKISRETQRMKGPAHSVRESYGGTRTHNSPKASAAAKDTMCPPSPIKQGSSGENDLHISEAGQK